MEDTIIVSGLEVHAHVGVPAVERVAPQRLTISLRLIPSRGLASLSDDIANTVDYATVCDSVRQEIERKPRHLIETLAEDIATLLLARFPLKTVEIEVRKYLLPAIDHAAVTIRRERIGEKL